MKYVSFGFIVLSFIMFACFSLNDPIEIKDVSKEQVFACHLDSMSWRWGLEVIKNTLDDTAKIGVLEIPPGKTGRLFLVERPVIDSIIVTYHPYKAQKGVLVLKCLCQ